MKENYYQTVLRNELDKRIKHNSNYSLRAMAKYLGIGSSGLSEIISGKRGLSLKFAVTLKSTLVVIKGLIHHITCHSKNSGQDDQNNKPTEDFTD